MKKEGERVHSDVEEEVSILKQLVDALDESEQRLEEFYKKKDVENLNKVKKFMLNANEKISEVIK